MECSYPMMSANLKAMSRAMMLALVFVALGFVALRPFCELALAAHGHASAGQQDPAGAPSANCCATVKGGTLVKPAEPLASWTQGGTLGTVLLASAGLLLLARSRDPARKLPAVLSERPFYARSARILR